MCTGKLLGVSHRADATSLYSRSSALVSVARTSERPTCFGMAAMDRFGRAVGTASANGGEWTHPYQDPYRQSAGQSEIRIGRGGENAGPYRLVLDREDGRCGRIGATRRLKTAMGGDTMLSYVLRTGGASATSRIVAIAPTPRTRRCILDGAGRHNTNHFLGRQRRLGRAGHHLQSRPSFRQFVAERPTRAIRSIPTCSGSARRAPFTVPFGRPLITTIIGLLSMRLRLMDRRGQMRD